MTISTPTIGTELRGVTNQRLLIIDDDLSFAQCVSMVAVEEGFVVEITARAEDFMAACLRAPPDVIVLDISMPVMDGIELIQWLAMLQPTNVQRVIIATGFHIEYANAARAIGLALGIDLISVLLKPFCVATLKTALRKPESGDLPHDSPHFSSAQPLRRFAPIPYQIQEFRG